MSEPEFEEELARQTDWGDIDWLLYVPEVMQIDDWEVYERGPFRRLTKAQQTLLYYSDVVGQTINGGIVQFFQNYGNVATKAEAALRRFRWPALEEKFSACVKIVRKMPGERQRRREAKFWSDASFPDQLREAQRRARKGVTINGRTYDPDSLYFDVPDLASELSRMAFAAEEEVWRVLRTSAPIQAFDDWFYGEGAKGAKARFVQFVRDNRSGLVRIERK